PGASVFKGETTTPVLVPRPGSGTPPRGGKIKGGKIVESETLMGRQAFAPSHESARRPPFEALPLAGLRGLVGEDSAEAAAVRQTFALGNQLGIAVERIAASNYLGAMDSALRSIDELQFYFSKRMEVEPVGLLHLERIGFTPAGIERGELTYSVPLSP